MAESRTFKVAVLASGEFLSSLAGLVIFAVLSRVLDVSDYATYRQTLLAYAFAAPLLMLGLPHALSYFLPGEQRRTRAVLLENLILLAVMGSVFSVFLLLGGNRLIAWRFRNPVLAQTLLTLAPYPLFVLPAAGVGACLVARGRVRDAASYNVLSRVVVLLIVLAMSLAWPTPTMAIIGTVVGAAVVLVPAVGLMLRATDEGDRRPTLGGMWAQLHYTVPLGLATMVGTVSLAIDKVIVASMCSAKEFAIYANGSFEIPLIGVLTGSVTAVILPELTRFHRAGQAGEAVELWKRGGARCALVILPAMCFLLFMAPEVMCVLFSSKYLGSSLPFRLYLLLLPIRIVSFGSLLMAAGRSRLILIESAAGLVINVVLSILLVRWVGYIGAIVGTILTIYLWCVVFLLVAIVRTYGVRLRAVLPYRSLAKTLALSAAASVVFLAKPWVSALGAEASLGLLGAAYLALIVLLFVRFGEIEYAAVRGLLARALPFFGRKV